MIPWCRIRIGVGDHSLGVVGLLTIIGTVSRMALFCLGCLVNRTSAQGRRRHTEPGNGVYQMLVVRFEGTKG